MKVTIRRSTGVTFSVEEESGSSVSVLSLKQRIAAAQDDLPVETQRLIYKGRILDDAMTLASYGIINDATLHLVKGKAPATKVPLASTSTTMSTTVTTTTPSTAPTSAGASTTTTPAPTIRHSPQQLLQQQLLLQQPPNPEQIAEMMNSPMLQSLLEQPDLIRTMMEMNPQMRDLMQQNPQLREVLNNPELMRQSIQQMRDPNAMRTAMRNQELAMSQIENMPGGFAALSNMYRDIQEPLMDAMGPTAPPPTTTANTGTHAANQQAGAVGAAMPNPWGAPPRSSPRNAATTGSSASASNTDNPWAMPPAAGPTMANPWALPTSNNLLQPPSTDQLEQTIQLLESNPHMQRMMDQMLADPATLQTMMQMDPRMQQVMQQNPAMAQMMQDPQFIRTMMNPASLRAMMQLQNSMGGAGPGAGGAMMPPMPMMRMPPPSYNVTPPPPQTPLMGGLDFSNLLQQMQSSNIHNPGDSPFGASSAFGGATPPIFAPMFAAPPFSQQPHPADRYHRQLASLRDMGFDDEQLCLRALEVNHGNLNRAVDMMIDGSVPGIGGTSATTATTTQTQQQQQEDTTTTATTTQTQQQQEDTTTTAAPPAPEQDGAPKDSMEKKND